MRGSTHRTPNAGHEVEAPTSDLRRAAHRTLDVSGAAPAHLALTLATTREIQRLNRDHRGIDSPTDVLSFPVDGTSPAPGPRELGDVVICPEHTDDLIRAAVHGVLHLLGHDHETDGGEMLAREDRIVATLR